MLIAVTQIICQINTNIGIGWYRNSFIAVAIMEDKSGFDY